MNRRVLPASCRQKKLGSADETSAARCWAYVSFAKVHGPDARPILEVVASHEPATSNIQHPTSKGGLKAKTADKAARVLRKLHSVIDVSNEFDQRYARPRLSCPPKTD